MRYEVIEARHWVNKITGKTASIYGAAPYHHDSDKMNWEVVANGWTVYNPLTGQVGTGRKPFETKDEAEAFANKFVPSRVAYGD